MTGDREGPGSFGSAVSDVVSEFMGMTTTPRSFATSWMAKAPAEDSESNKISQPSLLTSSRQWRAGSSGLPLVSRLTRSIMRPPSPPAALNFSISSKQLLRDHEPTTVARPD